jgi:hypothetical protein
MTDAEGDEMSSARVRWWLWGAVAGLLLASMPALALPDLAFQLRDEDLRIIGRDGSDEVGTALAVGDVSGDGIGDVILGAPLSKGFENRKPKAGEVAVVFGNVDLPGTVDLRNAARTFYGGTVEARLGTSVAAGDFDGDGVQDIIMGAPEADAPAAGEGAAYLFYGGARLTGSQTVDLGRDHADVILWGVEQGGRLGHALAVGDFNGDGLQDVAVSAPREGDPLSRVDEGAVYVLFGRRGLDRGIELFARTSGFEADYVLKVRGPTPRALTGQALAAGDVNGDGLDDLLVAAPWTAPIADTERGAVYALFGSFALGPGQVVRLDGSTLVDLRVVAPAAGGRFGVALAVADVNGDGIGDMLIGAPQADFVPGLRTGRAHAVFGRPFVRGTTIDLAADGADVTLAGPSHGAELGASVAGGDMNGDGLAEWIVGAPGADRNGQAYRILGRAVWSELGVVGALTQGARPGDRAGDACAFGDVNGDGLVDLVVGAPRFDGLAGDHPEGGAAYVVRGRPGLEPPSPNCEDADGDGFRAQGRTCGPQDCDDGNAAVHPLATEICDDGIDNNCDGFADGEGVDEDGDGWPGRADATCVVVDCNDRNGSINASAVESCGDGIDNDCDGFVDAADPLCIVPPENCANCIDDDGNGLGDLLEPACQGRVLQITGVKARRTKRKAPVSRRMLVKGGLDPSFLAGIDNDLLTRNLTVALAFPNGPQLCLTVGNGKRRKGKAVVLRSVAGPRTLLRVKRRKDGSVRFALQHRGTLELPAASPMTMAVGIFSGDTPYLGAAELRAKGKTLLQSGAP